MSRSAKRVPKPQTGAIVFPSWRPRRPLQAIVLVTLAVALQSRSARGAECTLRIEKVGPRADSEFGYAVSAAGDVSGDGIPDFAQGSGDARVYWYRGASGSFHRSVSMSGCFGQALALAGDIDADGVPDLLVGNPCAFNPELSRTTGDVTILSGRTGGVLRTSYGIFECAGYGSSVAGGGDVDGDATPDLLVGAPQGSCIPPDLTYVDLLSGADGHFIRWRLSQQPGGALGSSLAFIADLDGDGVADYLIGDAGANSVHVVSGASGQTIRDQTGDGHYGSSLASLGDLDGDGYPDFAVGAWSGRGAVHVYSGVSGALLMSLMGAGPEDSFGTRVEGIGDVSGDGWPDFVVGAPRPLNQSGGSAYVYSGRDGVLLCEIGGGSAGDYLGMSLARIGDLDGDGRSEFEIGAPFASIGGQTFTGRVVVYGVSLGPPLGEARHLELEKSTTSIELHWEPADPGCAGSDYAVYRGTLASLRTGVYDHTPVVCTTGGSTHDVLPPGAEAGEYFLVSVTRLNEEGSLGASSDGAPRPVGTPSCRPFRNPSACP